MLRCGKLEVSGGFLLVVAALYYLDVQGVLPWAAAACGLHELGHYLAIHLSGGRVVRLKLTCTGAEMILSVRRPLSCARELFAALTGPAVNLLLAVLSARLAPMMGEELYLFAGLNLGMAVFNLLPVAPLDGGRALRLLLTLLWSQELGEQVVRVTSMLFTAVLALCSIALTVRCQVNLTLPITTCWLLINTVSMHAKRRRFS